MNKKIGALITVTDDTDALVNDIVSLSRYIGGIDTVIFQGPNTADCIMYQPIYHLLKELPELKCIVYVDQNFDRLFDDDVADIFDELDNHIEVHINPEKMTWSDGSLRKDLNGLKEALKARVTSVVFGSYSDYVVKTWQAIYFDFPIKCYAGYNSDFDIEQFVIDMENFRAELYNLQYDSDLQFGGNKIEDLIIIEDGSFFKTELSSWSHPAMITTDITNIHRTLIDGYFKNITNKRLGASFTDTSDREM